MKIATATDRDRWLAFVAKQELPIDVQCDKWRKPRTLPQNAYLWSAVYTPLVERCGFSCEEWHDYFCQLKFGHVDHIKPSGEIESKPVRTTTKNEHGKRDVLKGEAFSDFVTFVEAQCAERGVFVLAKWEEA